jgi:histone acetyltransferase (RNA polymerase elongator complex component)
MASPTLTKDRTLIGLSNMTGDWETCSDPNASRSVSKRRRAANFAQEVIGGRLEFDDITVTRIWDEARDAALVTQFEARPDFFNNGTLSLTSLGTDGVPMGVPKTYNYVVQSMSRTGSDANSADESVLTVVLSVAAGA